MQKIDVIWKSYHEPDAISRGYWDQGMLEDQLAGPEFEHHTGFFPNGDGEDSVQVGAIVIINGRMHVEDTEAINADIARLRWVLFIITGDEEASFPWREIKHPVMRVWVQLPRMNEHNDTAFKLPNGYRPETRKLLREIGNRDRDNDWFFAGQINHARREQCMEAIVDLPEHVTGLATTTKSFGEEKLPYLNYLTAMAGSKVVLCPSGIETPDTFRLYEALEAGCVPVVDAFSTRHQSPGFWQYLFGDDIPFPIIDYWDKLPALLPELLRDYPHNANRVSAWWQNYKRKLYFKIIDDVKELSK